MNMTSCLKIQLLLLAIGIGLTAASDRVDDQLLYGSGVLTVQGSESYCLPPFTWPGDARAYIMEVRLTSLSTSGKIRLRANRFDGCPTDSRWDYQSAWADGFQAATNLTISEDSDQPLTADSSWAFTVQSDGSTVSFAVQILKRDRDYSRRVNSAAAGLVSGPLFAFLVAPVLLALRHAWGHSGEAWQLESL
eukprot:GILJ01018173.1.p1 GENE.GILJ01018173.1~~GILJ01018173.1.p1  ORF type:complete len:192 (-),score=13.23 GILJ01018173.1:219-794(-)